MPKPTPTDAAHASREAQIALRSLIWRVAVFFVAGMAVIAAFAIAYRFGLFAPSRP